MAGDKKDNTEEFQRRTRELLRAQQDAYLEAVKSWRQSIPPGMEPPPWPKMSGLEILPTMSEAAEASYAFAAKLLADQSKFMESLSKAMATSKEKT